MRSNHCVSERQNKHPVAFRSRGGGPFRLWVISSFNNRDCFASQSASGILQFGELLIRECTGQQNLGVRRVFPLCATFSFRVRASGKIR